MTSTPQKWLLGCGIGCAVLIMILVAFVTSGVLYVRGKFQPLQQAAESRNKLVAALGTPESFVPPPDGAILPEKMEAFLAIREQLRQSQERLDSAISSFDFDRLNQKQTSFGEVLGMLNDLSSLISPFGDYLGKRNQALLDRKMPLGEYLYIYSLAYHSWLGHDPEDGPPVLSKTRSGRNSNFSPEIIRGQYRRLFIRILGNQIRGIPDSDKSNMRKSVQNELDRLEKDFGRRVWQDGVPPPVEASLGPYRSRLESLYHRATNCFELLQLDERNRPMQWTPEAEQLPEPGAMPPAIPAEAEIVPETGKEAPVRITYSVGDGVLAPIPEKRPIPSYTEAAKKAGVEGTVELRGIVRKDGSIDSIRIVRGLGHGLDESAMRTVSSEWKFRPGELNGSPVDVPTTIEIRFPAK